MDRIKTSFKIREELCIERKAGPCAIVIFGASGDLTQRKLLPSLYGLYRRKLLPEKFYILGFARTALDDSGFREQVKESIVQTNKAGSDDADVADFLSRCHYISGDYDDPAGYEKLGRRMKELDSGTCSGCSHIFYLSTPPQVADSVVVGLGNAGLVREEKQGKVPRVRVVIEKPFGRDLASAKQLNEDLHKYLRECQIYRIDHYLGKETVQNIMMLRFANTIFSPVWSRDFVDHVQITVAEELGVGSRAGYYESAGVIRDMFQNHMMQILTLVAMDTPVSFDADRIRDERARLLHAIRPFPMDKLDEWIVRGQYGRGEVDGKEVPAYTEEPGIAPDSLTETYASAKVMIDNWRWQGVPFYLRSGKRLPRKVSQVAIVFRKVPHSVFMPIRAEDIPANVLVLNIQPDEGIGLTMVAKHPGPRLCLASLTMDFAYSEVFKQEPPEAYERLLLDVMLGDQTLFIRQDTMELAWSIFTPVLEKWEKDKSNKPVIYPAGTWGPPEADELLSRDGRLWREF